MPSCAYAGLGEQVASVPVELLSFVDQRSGAVGFGCGMFVFAAVGDDRETSSQLDAAAKFFFRIAKHVATEPDTRGR